MLTFCGFPNDEIWRKLKKLPEEWHTLAEIPKKNDEMSMWQFKFAEKFLFLFRLARALSGAVLPFLFQYIEKDGTPSDWCA